MLIIALLITAVESYLLGSCNSSIIVVKLLKHEDIREHGSKNAGLTNTLRCYGKTAALITLIGDLAKGVIASIIAVYLVFPMLLGESYSDSRFIDSYAVGYISGFFAILGHIFPLYYGFKGGKGVLVASSILLVIDPVSFCIVIPFFAVVVAVTKYVSVGSIAAACFYPILTFLVHYFHYDLSLGLSLLHTGLTVLTSILLIYMHHENIKRLKNGTENKFGAKKKDAVTENSNDK